MNADLLRMIDSICRDKGIEREDFVADLEAAVTGGLKKAYETEDAEAKLDPLTGDISAVVEGQPVDMGALGRITAQTVKQMMIQKTRERERGSILEEYMDKRGTIVAGTVTRIEKGNLLVQLGRVEGFLPRSEQIPGETHQVGGRLRALVLEVREQTNQVKVILSRSHPDFVVRLFELEVPEVAERIIEIKALAREAGYRTKVAVSSIDTKVDAVGACVGVRGSRIKNIVDELGGEKIDIVRWNESSQILIQNALKPAEVQEIALCLEMGKATVVVAEDQLSLAIGKRGQNVRLAARLTGWDVDILTPVEYNKNLELMEAAFRKVEGFDDLLLDKLIAIGCVSAQDIDELGPEPLMEQLSIEKALADRIVEEAGEEVIRQEEEKEAKEKARRAAIAAGLPDPFAKPAPADKGTSSFVSEDAAAIPTADATITADGETASSAITVGTETATLEAETEAPAASSSEPTNP
ncbi:MAG: transcription termination factor NusA [Phycisphaerae bacterium]